MQGHQVRFSTGTDEHGAKVEQAAQEAGKEVKLFCDEISGRFEALAAAVGSSHDVFVRTTDQLHRQTVAHVWKRLQTKGLLTSGVYSGFYSQPDEMFVPASRTALHADGKRHVSTESGHVLEWLEEETYEYPLAEFGAQVKEWAAQTKTILPVNRQTQVLEQMLGEEGLGNLSVSRSSARSSWGIPVPGDETHIIYVWLDALINYLTVAGFDGTDASLKGIWPPHTHVIGKEILRFHAVLWPAFLAGAGLALPEQIVAHGHWMVEGRKMSKSLGNVLDPHELIAEFGADALRYFLLSEMKLGSDSSFSQAAMQERTYADLADSLGNLIKRCTAKSIVPDRMVPAKPASFSPEEERVLDALKQLAQQVPVLMEELDFRSAISECMEVIRMANKFWDDAKPWKMDKEQNAEKLRNIVYITLETCRIVMTCLQPVMPNVTKAFLENLKLTPADQSAQALRLFHVDLQGKNLSPFDSFMLMEKKNKKTKKKKKNKKNQAQNKT
jgi:methionyl-tRNA synthetase